MKATFVFKTGYELTITCSSITITRSFGKVVGYEIENVSDNRPLYIDFDQILCVYREVTEEEKKQ